MPKEHDQREEQSHRTSYDHAAMIAITFAEKMQQEGRIHRFEDIHTKEQQEEYASHLEGLYRSICQQHNLPWPPAPDAETHPAKPLTPRFSLGQIVATPGALETLEQAEKKPSEYLLRHVQGDWGELDEEDIQENEFSVEHGFRLLSSYPLSETEEKLWIITEHDRSVTTLLRPDEY